jgi:membrane protease YdiL (CAAX protease family)
MRHGNQPGDSPQRRGAQIVALAAAFAVPTLGTWAYFVLWIGTPVMTALYVATKAFQVLFPAVWVWGVVRQRRQRAAAHGVSIAHGLLFALGVALLLGLAYVLLMRGQPFWMQIGQQIGTKLAGMGLTTPARYWAFVLFLSLAHSLLEEYYWRWFVCGQLQRLMAARAAACLSSVGFTAYHVIVFHEYLHELWWLTLLMAAGVAAGGYYWARLLQRHASLLGPWASHLAVDLAVFGLGYLMIFGQQAAAAPPLSG